MKILIITKNYYPIIQGGGEISCRLLVNNLCKHSNSVKVISFDGERKEKIDNVDVIRLKSVYGSFLGCNKYPKCKHTEKLSDEVLPEHEHHNKDEEKFWKRYCASSVFRIKVEFTVVIIDFNLLN